MGALNNIVENGILGFKKIEHWSRCIRWSVNVQLVVCEML